MPSIQTGFHAWRSLETKHILHEALDRLPLERTYVETLLIVVETVSIISRIRSSVLLCLIFVTLHQSKIVYWAYKRERKHDLTLLAGLFQDLQTWSQDEAWCYGNKFVHAKLKLNAAFNFFCNFSLIHACTSYCLVDFLFLCVEDIILMLITIIS